MTHIDNLPPLLRVQNLGCAYGARTVVRDISFDLEMPLPQRYACRGQQATQPVPASWCITALNDQHAYLKFDPAGPVPAVGDRIALGLSHPCTTFDKWRWLALVDDDLGVCGAISTQF